MASPEISQNLIPAEPTIADLNDLIKRDIGINFSCHHIGTIQEFNSENQTARVTINYKKTYFKKNEQTGLYEALLADYPILLDCPCIFLGGGDSYLTFPVKKNDECIVFFNDRDIDNWFEGSNQKAVATSRLHSISDGIVLVGVRSKPNVISEFDNERVLIKHKDLKLGVGEEKLLVTNAAGDSLNDLLQELIDEIKDLVTQVSVLTVTGVTGGPGTSGVPSNAAAITAIGSQITATASKIEGLLE